MSQMAKFVLNVNGAQRDVTAHPDTPLLWVLREQLKITGTKYGCGIGQCGACTVHMNGKAVKSCSMLAMQAEGAQILTIEGVAHADGSLHPMQAALQHQGLR